jgi:hypothetical protein
LVKAQVAGPVGRLGLLQVLLLVMPLVPISINPLVVEEPAVAAELAILAVLGRPWEMWLICKIMGVLAIIFGTNPAQRKGILAMVIIVANLQ